MSACFRPIALAFSPEEAAAALAHRAGMVFLDSSAADGASISLLACEPEAIYSGGSGDWGDFQAELKALRSASGDTGLPAGAAIGWRAFDGGFRFGIYRDLLVYLHGREQWLACGSPILPEAAAMEIFAGGAALDFRPEISPAEYCRMVREAQALIAAGDIYQVCLAHRWTSRWEGDPWRFYGALRHCSPAPQAAFLNLAGVSVLSASPESFLRISGRQITTRPIKGTRPRRADPGKDERSACDLITSAKEIAELVMITDLERNDLGRICQYASVHVPDLLRLEKFEHVFHLVSTVEGRLRPEISHPAALDACFPGGSISGAPKKRAIEIISALEPAPRGIYTGAVGYFGFNDESAFNIAIRTVVIEDDTATFHVGAGIVADSIPENEWQETLDKAAGIRLAARELNQSARPAPAAARRD